MNSRYPSKTSMRRYVNNKGGYFSGTGQWVFVSSMAGALYFSSLEEIYDAIDTLATREENNRNFERGEHEYMSRARHW